MLGYPFFAVLLAGIISILVKHTYMQIDRSICKKATFSVNLPI
jgi:hypothetical protein